MNENGLPNSDPGGIEPIPMPKGEGTTREGEGSASRDEQPGQPRRGWVPCVGERVRTRDDGNDNIGRVLALTNPEDRSGMAHIEWIGKDGAADKWISVSDVHPLENQSKGGAGLRTNAGPPPPWQPFPLEVLPPVVCEYVRELAMTLGVQAGWIAPPLLAVLAAAIGAARVLRIKADWIAIASLWVLLIAESGGMKSPVLRAILRWMRVEELRLLSIYGETRRQHARDREVTETALKAWREKKKAAERERHGESASAQPTGTEFSEPPPMLPEAPGRQRRIVEDATVEALAPILKDSPRGLLLWRDEAGGWLDGMNEYKRRGADASRWNALYDGGPLCVDRKGGEAPSIYVHRTIVSIVGGIQPGVLARRMSPDAMESGLLPRCLLVYPKRQPKRWSDAELFGETADQMGALFQQLFNLDMPTDADGAPAPRELSLNPEARDAWKAFVNGHGTEGDPLVGADASWHAKIEAAAARLTLILAVVREPSTLTATKQDVEAAITIARWWENEIDRTRILLAQSEEDRAREALIALIRREGGRITARDLGKKHRAMRPSAVAKAALDALVAGGYGAWEQVQPGPKGGRPTRVFVLKPEEAGGTSKEPPDEPDALQEVA